jgi:putative ATPase
MEGSGGRILPYDKASEEHHNAISAFIKSMRASDPDAAVYYLARMLESGEDPMFIARRMIIFASEDVGNAEPRGLLMAVAAKEALETVGLPEARINLAHAAITLALARKDRAVYDAIEAAIREVRETGALPVPMILRNAVTPLMKREGYGKGDPARLIPEGVKERVYFRPRGKPDTQ